VLRRVEVAGRPVLVARTGAGEAIAVGPICPHQGLPMDGGNVYGDEIDCPTTTTPTTRTPASTAIPGGSSREPAPSR
jgi:hypothetical protein